MSTNMVVVIDFEYVKVERRRWSSKILCGHQEYVSFVPIQEHLRHDFSRLRRARLELRGRSHSLPRIVHVCQRGGGRFRSHLRLRCRKLQTTLEIKGVPDSRSWRICPQPTSFNHRRWRSQLCLKFPNVYFATKNKHTPYDLLMYHLQTNCYAKCPKDITRHTAKLFTRLKTEERTFAQICIPQCRPEDVGTMLLCSCRRRIYSDRHSFKPATFSSMT